MNIFAQRLLNVARACRETRAPDRFDMGWDVHPCGTPGCAFGNYACRTDLQKDFTILWKKSVAGQFPHLATTDGHFIAWDDAEVGQHFGLGYPEVKELFHWEGCGYAKTHIQAAEYIEAFVARKWPAPTPPNWKAIAASPLIPEHVKSEELVS